MPLSTGNSENTSSGTLRSPRGNGAKPVFEIFLDGEQRKDFAALRHISDAAPGALRRPQRGDVAPLPGDFATAHREMAGKRIEKTCLADAIPAEHASHFAGLRLERHRAQRLGGAVVQVDGLRFKHQLYSLTHDLFRKSASTFAVMR